MEILEYFYIKTIEKINTEFGLPNSVFFNFVSN